MKMWKLQLTKGDNMEELENENISVEQDTDIEDVNNSQEDVNNQPLIIETKGKWQPFEAMTGQTLEVGKTYNIKVEGKCEFMISKDRPTFGFGSNEITYTKDSVNRLWIKTGN